MSKYDADAMFPPIEVRLEGKDYVLEAVTQGTMDTIQRLAQEIDKNDPSSGSTTLIKQVALLLKVDPEELRNVDVRKLIGVSRFIIGEVTKGLDSAENPTPEVEAKA